MNRLPMHNALKSLAWLEGTWRTHGPGQGQFPTINAFNYCDELTFTSIGQPMFNYESMTWNPETKAPMHREVGVLKIIPQTNRVKLILAHNFGLTTIEEGTVNGRVIQLESSSISRMSEGNKDPAVIKLKREFKCDGDSIMKETVWMSTTKTPELTKHLEATYVKQSAIR